MYFHLLPVGPLDLDSHVGRSIFVGVATAAAAVGISYLETERLLQGFQFAVAELAVTDAKDATSLRR